MSGSVVRPDGSSVASGGMEELWEVVGGLVAWLDAARILPPEQDQLLRIMKLTEEAGEVTAAVIGAIGQNPRKGRSHTWADVEAELCDVVLTALVALRTINPDAPAVFAGHVARVAARSLAQDGAQAPTAP